MWGDRALTLILDTFINRSQCSGLAKVYVLIFTNTWVEHITLPYAPIYQSRIRSSHRNHLSQLLEPLLSP